MASRLLGVLLCLSLVAGQTFPSVLDINFLPQATESCEVGHILDTGSGLGKRDGGLIYGWVQAGTTVPQFNNGGRSRDIVGIQCIERTVMHMQYNDCCNGNGFNGHLEWEISLPNGLYRIEAVMGDSSKNSVHSLKSHTGVVIIPPSTPRRRNQFFSGMMEVQVTDGRLRLSAEDGGVNAKLNFVKIVSLSAIPVVGGVSPTSIDATGCVPNPSQYAGLPISPLTCDKVKIDLPFHVNFDVATVGIKDKNGKSTGFRSVIPSSHIASYDPSRLQLRNNRLEYTTAKGHWNNGRNSGINPLGVGLPVPGKKVRMTASVKLPPPVDNGRERFCVFTAVSQEHFFSLCVRNSGPRGESVYLRYEKEDRVVDKAAIGVTIGGHRVVTLQLEILPADDMIRASFKVPGAPSLVTLQETIVDPFLLNKDQAATSIEVGTRTHGGIHAYQRPISDDVTYEVLSFTVEEIPDAVTSSSDSEVDFDVWKVEDVQNPTSMSWAPDGKLFIAQVSGSVTVLQFNEGRTAVTNKVVFRPIGSRLLLGITIDLRYGTDGNDCVWLSHSDESQNNGRANSGKITKVCGPNLDIVEDVIVGLPRAIANHAVNNIVWGPEEQLYITCGSNTASGVPNTLQNSFLLRPEQHFSAAILRANVLAADFKGDCTPSQDPDEMDALGIALIETPSCDVELYATGTRNPFDCVWHPNGHLYCPDNGVGGAGTKPILSQTYSEGDTCDTVVAGAEAIAEHDTGVREDLLYDVKQGAYYGHPNPARLECVLYGGNPTKGADVKVPRLPIEDGKQYRMDFSKYPVGVQSHSSFQTPMVSLGKNRSPDGILAYESDAMCGKLKNELIVVFFSVSPEIHRFRLNEQGTAIVADSTLIKSTKATGADEDLKRPLGIAQDKRGTIFVAEFGGNRISVMVPKPVASCT